MNTIDITSRTENEAALPGQADESDFVKEVTENLRKGRNHFADWRLHAREDFDFYAGKQWDEGDSAKLDKEGRPAVVFNRIVRTINAVSGVEVQNRQEVKYFPRKIDDNQDPQALTDTGLSDVLNGAAAWVREQNNSEDEESEAFQDCLICGIGWTETLMDYEEDPDGKIIKSRIDPLQVIVDPDSVKRNYEDAKWVALVKDMDKKEVEKMFPGLDSMSNGSFWNDQDASPHDADDAFKYINDQSDQLTKAGKISVVQYQYYQKEPNYMVMSQDGNLVTLSGKKYRAAKRFIDQAGLQSIKINKRVYKQCFLVGNVIAEKMDLGCDHFTIRAMTGLRDRNKNQWFGLVRIMQDPQRWANKWLSQIQHILNTNSKGGLLVETGAVKNRRTLEDDWASPDAIIELNPGGLEKIREKTQAQYPDGIDRLLNYAVGAINDVPGVNLELIGMADRNQPIGLEQTRKQSGITVLANFFDSLRRYRKMDGRILAYFIREYIADGRLIRILGPTGSRYVPLMKDKLAFNYDIIVDDAPTSPNVKERTFAIMNQLIPVLLQAGIPIPPEILDYAPLPEDLIQKWKQMIANQSNQPPDPAQEEMKQIQLLLLKLEAMQDQANIQKTGSETARNYATAQKDQSVGQEQSALALQKFGVLQGTHDAKVDAMYQDQQRKDREMMLNQWRKLLEVQLNAELKQRNFSNVPSLNTIQ